MLGLLEAMNDYKMKAHHLRNCALAGLGLARELKSRASGSCCVQEFGDATTRAQVVPG